MNVTLALDEVTLREARRRAEALGTSVNQLVRDYLEEFTGGTSSSELAAEFDLLSQESTGNSGGWKFNRDEIYSRR